jgi:choline-sulfatase
MDWARTVRTDRWRYTFYPCGGGKQLFDVREDPQEQDNRAGDPACAAVRRELRDRLMEMAILQDYPLTQRELFGLGLH